MRRQKTRTKTRRDCVCCGSGELSCVVDLRPILFGKDGCAWDELNDDPAMRACKKLLGELDKQDTTEEDDIQEVEDEKKVASWLHLIIKASVTKFETVRGIRIGK